MLQHKRAFSAQYDNLIQLVGPIGWDQVATDQMQDLLLSEQIVAVLVPVYVDQSYSYCVPEHMAPVGGLRPGMLVRVPLGPRSVLGVVWDDDAQFKDASRLKNVEAVFGDFCLSDDLRKFVDWIASYTLAQRGMVLRMILRGEDALQPDKPVKAIRLVGEVPNRLTKARSQILSVMENGLARSKKEVMEEAGVSSAAIDGLIKAGTLGHCELPPPALFEEPIADFAPPTLSDSQQEAADEINACFETGGFQGMLLDGVTGSGKTEVYFEALARCLEKGQQALILVPEIALTNAFLDRFTARFGARPAEWHSDLSQKQKNRVWREVAKGRAKVVVGARSALMLPFRDLGLIVVDEEHDGAFKQEDRVIYNARDMAVVRGHLSGFPVILASATPSVETRNNANVGRYKHIKLTSRYGGFAMPDIRLVDMRSDSPEKGRWLAPSLVNAVNETLEAGEQSLLFLNRRGYAPLTLCRSCGHRFQCPSCSTWLVEHRFRKLLMCHHCGHSEPVPPSCPSCGAEDNLAACGPGVERVAEEVAERWPDRRVVILSSDLIHGVAQLRAELDAIAKGEADIVIGTQLVAKGHNFPAMTLVGVIDADLGLAHGDLRAGEKVFQMLAQVTGRAGRMGGKGRGLLQTHASDHPVIQCLSKGDWEGFYTYELEQRQRAQMPPFGRLAALIISGEDREAALMYGRELVRHVPQGSAVRVLGPAEAPLAVLRGRYRFRLLVWAERSFGISSFLRHWLGQCPTPRGSVRLQVDVDPVSFV
jgi:primosomal protein N' (replication factor Y)